MPHSLPHFFALSPEKVREAWADAELRRSKTVFHFIPDVHDLAYFCFPINPANASSVNINEVADDQLALFEVFIRHDPKPILVQEYEHELQRNYRSLEQASEFAYSRTEMLRELLQHVESIPADRHPAEAVNSLERDFNVVVAVVTGIYSLGLQRWREVVSGRLLLESQFAGSVEPQILKAFREYRPTALVEEIKGMLIAKVPKHPALEIRRYLRERAAENDARAVDKVLHLNRYLEAAYQTGKLPQRHVFLYFASARRTSSIFDLPSVRAAFSIIEGKPFPPWRNKTQIFLSMVLRPGFAEDSEEEYSVLANNLRRFEQLLRNVRQPKHAAGIYDRCSDCFLNGGRGSNCVWAELCKLIRNLSSEYLKEQASVLPNLGLLANIQRYSKFVTRRSELQSGEDVRNLFASLLDNSRIRDVTLERIWLVQQSMSLNSVLLQAAPPDISEEVITSAMQVLPFAVQIREPEYRTIVRDLINYYQIPYEKIEDKQALLSRIYGAFVALDRPIVQYNPEHEIVRSLIYLAFEGASRKGRSLEQVESALERLNIEKEHETKWYVEFAYIKIWTLRLHNRYEECHEFAQNLLSRFPKDARMYHGFLLNAYSWYEKHHTRYTVSDLIHYANKTKELYLEFADHYRQTLSGPELIDNLIGVAYNDLAYLNCFEENSLDLPAANENLEQVSVYVPRKQWPEKFPEYLHTEAMLLYREAQSTRSVVKLAEADAKASIASRNRKTARFVDLQNKIEKLKADIERD
jgi:hypothetical protein